MVKSFVRGVALSLFLSALLFDGIVFAALEQEGDIRVEVQVSGENVIVDASLLIPASRQETWAVLTDFEHMAGFISNVKESKVLNVSGDILKISQRGSANYGPVKFPFESVREIHLMPFDRIQSRMISGNVRKMESVTQLFEENGKTRVIYHADSVPGVWIPPIVGKAFIAHEAREQFQEMRNETVRRKEISAAAVVPQ